MTRRRPSACTGKAGHWPGGLLFALLLAAAVPMTGTPDDAAAGERERLETRFGVLEIAPVEDPDSSLERLLLDGELFLDVVRDEFEGWWFDFVGYWPHDEGGRSQDFVLVERLSTGNTVCSFDHILIRLSASEIEVWPGLASCASDVVRAAWSGSSFEIDLRSFDLRYSAARIVWKGGEVDERLVARTFEPGPVPGGGADVLRWEGRLAWEILEDPGEQRRLLTIMPPAALFDLWDNISTAMPAHVADGWLIATGCKPHNCGFTHAAIAIEVATGRPQALIWSAEEGIRVFGATRPEETPLLDGRIWLR